MKTKGIIKVLTRIDNKIHKHLLNEMVIIEKIKHTQDTAGLKKLEVKLKKTSRKLNSVHLRFELFKNAMLERSNQNKDNPKYIAIKEFINNL